MTDAPKAVPADIQLLELFRAEMETHGAALLDGLGQPHAGGAPDALLNKLFRAARAIKGASAVASLPASAALAGAIEGFFAGAQRGERALDGDSVPPLQQAARLFAVLSAARAADIPAALEARNDEVLKLTEAIKGLSRAPASIPAPAAAPPGGLPEPGRGGTGA